MTEKNNERNPDLNDDARVQSNNPLEELAKIIGYQDEQDNEQNNALSSSGANEAAIDLEAELLREFGQNKNDEKLRLHIKGPNIKTENVMPAGEKVEKEASSIPKSNQEVDEVLEDDVLNEMDQYIRSGDQSSLTGIQDKLGQDEPGANKSGAEQALQIEHSGQSIEQQIAAAAFTSPGLSRATSTLAKAIPTALKTPKIPSSHEPIRPAQPQVTHIPSQQSVETPPETPPVSTDHNNFSVENFASKLNNELEQGLAQLKDDVFADIKEMPKVNDVSIAPEADTIEQDNQATPFDVNYPALQKQVEIANKDIFREDENELEAVLNVADFKEIDNEVEETTPFDIPDIPEVEEFLQNSDHLNAHSDLELEREFSQLLADDLIVKEISNTFPSPDRALSPERGSVDVNYDPVLAGPVLPIISAFADKAETEATAEIDEKNSLSNPVNQTFDAGFTDKSQNKYQDKYQDKFMAPPPINPERVEVTDNHDMNPQILKESNNQGSHMFAIIGVLSALVIGGGAYLYFQNSSGIGLDGGEPVIIKADKTDIRKRPEIPGGTSVPNQDQAVYTQVEGNDVSIANQSSLVENTEEPVDIVQRTIDPSLLPDNNKDNVDFDKNNDRLTPNAVSTDKVAANETVKPLVTPRRVQSVIVQADGTIISPKPVEAVSTPDLGEQVVTQDIADTVKPVIENNAIRSAPGVKPDIKAENVEVSAITLPIPSVGTTTLSDDSMDAILNTPVNPDKKFSGYYMQISSQPSLEAAQSSYKNLVQRFKDLIGNLVVKYQKVAITDKGTFHRVRIEVGTRSEANELCLRYKAAGGRCFVTK